MEGGHGVRESDRLGSGLAAPVSAPWVWSLVSESAVPWLLSLLSATGSGMMKAPTKEYISQVGGKPALKTTVSERVT